MSAILGIGAGIAVLTGLGAALSICFKRVSVFRLIVIFITIIVIILSHC